MPGLRQQKKSLRQKIAVNNLKQCEREKFPLFKKLSTINQTQFIFLVNY